MTSSVKSIEKTSNLLMKQMQMAKFILIGLHLRDVRDESFNRISNKWVTRNPNQYTNS